MQGRERETVGDRTSQVYQALVVYPTAVDSKEGVDRCLAAEV